MDTKLHVPRYRLRRARELQGLSQQEVARHIGTTPLNVSRWEQGLTRPASYFRSQLCSLFGKNPSELDLLPSADPAAGLYDPALPVPAAPLVGRESQLGRLKEQLCRVDHATPVVLQGLPGVGKTALAIAIAHDQEMRAHFRDGVLWASLGPKPGLSHLFHRWGALLGLHAPEMALLSDHDSWCNALYLAARAHRMLLVIDDAWHAEEAQLCMVGGNHCAYLVTTRFPLLAAELSPHGVIPLEELGEDDGMILFRMLVPKVVGYDEQQARALVRAVGGLPLALTLMGDYLRDWAYSGQPRHIRAALGRLFDGKRRLQIRMTREFPQRYSSRMPGTESSLEAALAVTIERLPIQARNALRALAAFPPKPDSFTEEDAEAAGCTETSLDGLYEAGLLESSVPGRYMLHPILVDYARSFLA